MLPKKIQHNLRYSIRRLYHNSVTPLLKDNEFSIGNTLSELLRKSNRSKNIFLTNHNQCRAMNVYQAIASITAKDGSTLVIESMRCRRKRVILNPLDELLHCPWSRVKCIGK